MTYLSLVHFILCISVAYSPQYVIVNRYPEVLGDTLSTELRYIDSFLPSAPDLTE